MFLGVVGSDAYKWLLALHILFAVVWVGSDVAIQIFVSPRQAGGGRPGRLLRRRDRWYGSRILVPASLLLVILGFILLHESSGAYDLAQGWVTFGFVVWLLSLIAGTAYSARSRAGSASSSRSAAPRTPSISAGSAGSSSFRESSWCC